MNKWKLLMAGITAFSILLNAIFAGVAVRIWLRSSDGSRPIAVLSTLPGELRSELRSEVSQVKLLRHRPRWKNREGTFSLCLAQMNPTSKRCNWFWLMCGKTRPGFKPNCTLLYLNFIPQPVSGEP